MTKAKKNTSVVLILLVCFMSYSQGTLKEYQKANAVDSLFKNKVFNTPKEFHWITNNSFWYINNAKKGNEFLLVDAKEQKQTSAFNQERLAASLSKNLEKKITPNQLPIDNLEFSKDFSNLIFTTDSLKISCDLKSYELSKMQGGYKKPQKRNTYWGDRFDEQSKREVKSPDLLYSAFIKNYNLYIKNIKTEVETQLSYDGSKGFYYSSYLEWAPDSKKIMAYKVRPGEEHKIYFVESSPKDQFQPKLQDRDYLKPGDQLPFKSPQLFDIASKKHLAIATDLFQSQYSVSNFDWKDDSSGFTFEFNERGHQIYRVLDVNATDGNVKVLIEEKSPTFIDYSGKKYRYDAKKSKEIVWASERDGWNHLYLIDANTGKVKNQITKGNWPLRDVVKVDEEHRLIYFTASGLDKDQDPYLLHYCSIDFDGKNFKRLTTENGNHNVTFSTDYKFYVDQYSRVDMAPITLLKSVNSKSILKLQEADISELQQTGWKIPEVFSAKGRDGKTDIWGMIVRPTTFDPNRSYPIVEYIYAGPHDSFVPKNFQPYYWAMSSLAELGFIVVQIDGMGTSNRSKAFQDVCWKNLKDAGFPDRKLWMKAAAVKYPYMNIDKVGIHGTSAGGQNAAAALVFNSDFYDVAVSSCGCHDNRMDKMWWNEQWMGYPIGPEYEACSNTVNAAQMGGNLMLILGELDDNVDPATTMQFANALIKANKNFELVTIPGMGHSAGGDYGERKRRDYFVQHLMDVTPPTWDKIYK
jgi:dipeptidyl aminopeptidase/acylaminoacyl peptidase